MHGVSPKQHAALNFANPPKRWVAGSKKWQELNPEKL
jgi:hypothetical protein